MREVKPGEVLGFLKDTAGSQGGSRRDDMQLLPSATYHLPISAYRSAPGGVIPSSSNSALHGSSLQTPGLMWPLGHRRESGPRVVGARLRHQRRPTLGLRVGPSPAVRPSSSVVLPREQGLYHCTQTSTLFSSTTFPHPGH